MRIKFNRDFYNPLTRTIIKKGDSLDIEAKKDIPLDAFWRGILKDNSITNIVEIAEVINKKKNK